jgi:AcrR family transcriptional regulator
MRSEMMISEVEDIALSLFAARGFSAVTVDEIAAEAQISVRTFYRYFPSKEHIFLVRADRRGAALSAALVARPVDEPPLRSVRVALTEVTDAEDIDVVRRWVAVIAQTPEVVPSVLGSLQIKVQGAIAEFLAGRLGEEADAFVPQMLAAAVGGVAHAATARWFAGEPDLAATIAAGIEVLEQIGPGSPLWATAAQSATSAQ